MNVPQEHIQMNFFFIILKTYFIFIIFQKENAILIKNVSASTKFRHVHILIPIGRIIDLFYSESILL